MATWAIVLIVVGAVLGVGGLVYVMYRWGKKSSYTKIALSGAAAIFNVLESVFKDDPEKTDASDFMGALGDVSAVCMETLVSAEKGVPFTELKDSMKAKVGEILAEFPEIKDKVTDEVLDRAVNAFFMLVSSIPKVNGIIKK